MQFCLEGVVIVRGIVAEVTYPEKIGIKVALFLGSKTRIVRNLDILVKASHLEYRKTKLLLHISTFENRTILTALAIT
jgi:hypothetical protein